MTEPVKRKPGRPPVDRPAFDQLPIKVGHTTYQRVTEVKKQIEEYEKRAVTYSETLDILVRHWEQTGQLIADARGTT